MRTTKIRMARWLQGAVLLAIASGVMAAACVSRDEIPPIERRAQQVNQGIMCPVCPGESLDQSQHPLSVQMRAIVMEKLEDGWTQGRINEFFVERYGPSVLLEPPREGLNLLVWLVPPVGILLAGFLLFGVLRLMLRSRALESDGAVAAVRLTGDDRDRYFRRIEATLAYDGSEDATGDPDGPIDSEAGEKT